MPVATLRRVIAVEHETLETELPLVRLSVPGTRSVTALVAFDAGARTERAEENGMAHFLEHLVFKGGKSFPTYRDVNETAERLGADGDVERDEVVARVGVQHPAHALGGLIDLAVVVVELAALEHEVLEEVRHPVLLRPLGAGAGVEGDEDRRGACALEGDPVDREPVGGGGGADLRHPK